MATVVGIAGTSSSGKSTSLRNLDHTQTYIVSPSKAEVPFGGFREKYVQKSDGTGNFYRTNSFKVLSELMVHISNKRPEIKVIVVEDLTHFFTSITLGDEFRNKGKTKDGTWSRWNDLGAVIYDTLFGKIATLREDLIIIYQFHIEVVSNGLSEVWKLKTPGSLLEREVDLPSYFTYLLYTKVLPYDKALKASERYLFVTNDDGVRPAKTPYGLFDEETELNIPSDMALVIDRIRKF